MINFQLKKKCTYNTSKETHKKKKIKLELQKRTYFPKETLKERTFCKPYFIQKEKDSFLKKEEN